MENKTDIMLGIKLIPDFKQEQIADFKYTNIVNISNVIINNRIYIRYKNDDGTLKCYSCFIFLTSNEVIKTGDYLLSYNNLYKALNVSEDYIELEQYIDDNRITFLIHRKSAKKVVASTYYKIKKELPIVIDKSFIKKVVMTYINHNQVARFILVRNSLKVNEKTKIILSKIKVSDNDLIKVFKAIINSLALQNKNYSLEFVINKWKERIAKKKISDEYINQLLINKKEELTNYYYEKIKE